MLGLDIYYRKTGNDYKIRQLYLGKDINTDAIRGTNFGGLTSLNINVLSIGLAGT